jgi:hypothetical protein
MLKRAARNACGATFVLGTGSAFVLGQRINHRNLDGFNRSQDLPDGFWLASRPASKYKNLTAVLACTFDLFV